MVRVQGRTVEIGWKMLVAKYNYGPRPESRSFLCHLFCPGRLSDVSGPPQPETSVRLLLRVRLGLVIDRATGIVRNQEVRHFTSTYYGVVVHDPLVLSDTDLVPSVRRLRVKGDNEGLPVEQLDGVKYFKGGSPTSVTDILQGHPILQ